LDYFKSITTNTNFKTKAMQLSSSSSFRTFNWQILLTLKSDAMKHIST